MLVVPQVARVVKKRPANAGDIRYVDLIPGLGRSPGRGHATHSSILAGESHGQRNLVGYSQGVAQNQTQLINSHTHT